MVMMSTSWALGRQARHKPHLRSRKSTKNPHLVATSGRRALYSLIGLVSADRGPEPGRNDLIKAWHGLDIMIKTSGAV